MASPAPAPSSTRTPTACTNSSASPGRLIRASFLDITGVKDTQSNLPHKIPAVGEFARHLEKNDIRPTDQIVFYDDFSVVGAARAHFLFSHFGIKTLIGNFTIDSWIKQNFPVEEGEPTFKPEVASPEVGRGRGLRRRPVAEAAVGRRQQDRNRPDFAGGPGQ